MLLFGACYLLCVRLKNLKRYNTPHVTRQRMRFAECASASSSLPVVGCQMADGDSLHFSCTLSGGRMESGFDRTLEDIGNIVHLEHVNVKQPDQRLATIFYISGLGLTRDPYMKVGVDNMWVNAGRNQIHLPTGNPQ